MNTWPILSRKISHTFADEKNPDTVLVGSTGSGYPHLNKLFTFDARTFPFEMRSTPEADKLLIFAFYEANKEVPFYWPNPQDSTTYEVCFTKPPRCRIDGRIDLWRILIELKQTSAETS